MSGERMALLPPTRAVVVSFALDLIVSQARCRATSELEQAVSSVTDGPDMLL